MTHGRTPAPRQQGFTLIEILVAMLVFLTGVAGIYALLSTGLSMQQDGLEMSRAGRHVEEVVQLLQAQLEDGGLRADVQAATLADGTFYRMTYLAGQGGKSASARLVEIRVAGTQKGLDQAAAFPYVLGAGPSMAEAVRAWRARRVSAVNSRSTLEDR